MWFFDGRRWKAGFFGRSATLRYTALSGPVNYTVTLEPHNKPWLFALDLPAVTPERARSRRTSRCSRPGRWPTGSVTP